MSPPARFRKGHPCPICNGFDEAPRGTGLRCYGFLSNDGRYAHCTSDEHAGGLRKNSRSDTYAHRLIGDCRCGTRHDPSLPSSHSTSRGKRIVATYDYVDEEGMLLYQVVRYTNPKDFRQRRPDGQGGWLWNLQGVRRVPYRLPELLAAIQAGQQIVIPEGEKDVERLIALGYASTCNAMGAKKWPRDFARYFQGAVEVVVLADNDEDGRAHAAQVGATLRPVVPTIKRHDFTDLHKGGDVSDWLRAGHTAEDLAELLTEAPPLAEGSADDMEGQQRREDTSEKTTDKPVIEITTAMTAVVNATEQAILNLLDGPHLFQRARQLCLIAHGVKPPQWLNRPPQAPVIVPAEAAHVRELATQAADWQKWDKRQKAWEPAMPPTWVLETLYARPSWTFPSLEGIVCAPTLRPDGGVLATPGYDEATGLYLDLNGASYPTVRDHPTLHQARTAIGRLQEVFMDFPFAAPHHFSTVLAAILSLVARYAIQGNIPLFAVRSTTRGTGKGLLIDAISVIATGRPAPRWAHTLDEDEERKRLLTIALAGDALVHIDNVSHAFGSPPLDMAITAPSISGRMLGQLQSREAPMQVVFFASGNNMVFRGDMARRVVPIDLAPEMERPEERDTFTHSPLLPWVMKNRPALVVAALTILKAYFAAGRPRQKIKPLGSFEAWSDLVRQALVWAGEEDPCTGRQEIEADSDPQYEALQTVLAAWYDRYGIEEKMVRQVVEDVRRHTGEALVSSEWEALRDALGSLDPQYPSRGLNPKLIGEALRRWKGRMIEGRRFVKSGQGQNPATWRIEVMTQQWSRG